MFKSLITFAALVVVPTSAMADFKGNSGATRKSERQKCLDLLLPQDGVDCLKKLKAKKKK